MHLPKKEYYSLQKVALGCRCTKNDLLYYGETGLLQLCVMLENTVAEARKFCLAGKVSQIFQGSAKPVIRNIAGIYPVCGEDVLRISRGQPIDGVEDFGDDSIFYVFGLIDNDLKFQPTGRKFEIADLVIPHEEKARFEAFCDMTSGNDIGEKERITWLKIIYLSIRKLADHRPNLAKPSGVNVSQLAEVLKKAAKEYGLSGAGLSKSSLNKIYNEALESLMPHTK